MALLSHNGNMMVNGLQSKFEKLMSCWPPSGHNRINDVSAQCSLTYWQ